jgi:hypothetical protein
MGKPVLLYFFVFLKSDPAGASLFRFAYRDKLLAPAMTEFCAIKKAPANTEAFVPVIRPGLEPILHPTENQYLF